MICCSSLLYVIKIEYLCILDYLFYDEQLGKSHLGLWEINFDNRVIV